MEMPEEICVFCGGSLPDDAPCFPGEWFAKCPTCWAKDENMQLVEVSKLRINPLRSMRAQLTPLAFMATCGQRFPIQIKPCGEIIHGERRYVTAQLAGWKYMLAEIVQ